MKDMGSNVNKTIGWTQEEKKAYIEEIQEYAKKYIQMGLAIIPIVFKKKNPPIDWKKYQEKPPQWEEISMYFERATNIGIITGVPSGGLVVLDFDDMGVYEMIKHHIPEIENTFLVKTSKGVHAYFRVKDHIVGTTKIGKVDIKGQGGLVVAPPSIHPSGAKYTILNENPIKILTIEQWEAYYHILETLIRKTNISDKGIPTLPVKKGRKLTKGEINKILEVIQPLYLQGYRDYIVMYLSGWLYKSQIDYESAKEIIEILAEKDEEKRERLRVLERTYLNIQPEKIKGKTGLQEVLNDILISKGLSTEEAESKTLQILNTLQEVIGEPSPYHDSILYLLDREHGIYAVANFRSRRIYKARMTKEGLKYTQIIAEGVPNRVIVYYDAINPSVIQYEIEFIDTLGKSTIYGPEDLEGIVNKLKKNGIVIRSIQGRDIITAILWRMAHTGKAEVRTGTNQPGFYIINGDLIPIGYEEQTEIDQDDLREALLFLDKLVMKIFKAPEKTATILKWGIVAPFSYIRKYLYPEQNYQPWLYVYGPTQAGKTTRGEVIANIWGLDTTRYIIPITSINTEARLGKVLSSSTFPYTIREVGTIFENPALTEMMKGAIESLEARGKYEKSTWITIPSLAPLIFTSNRKKPKDPALLERFLIISFSREEVYTYEDKVRFNQEIRPKLHALRVIGQAVYLYIKSRYLRKGSKYFKTPWERMAEEVLSSLYEIAGLTPPEWIKYHYEDEEPSEEEDIGDNLRAWFLEEINRAYRNVDYTLKDHLDYDRIKAIQTTEELYSYEYESLSKKVSLVFGGYHIPWGKAKNINGVDYIVIYRSILPRLPMYIQDLLQGNFGNLEDILRYEGLQTQYDVIWDPTAKKSKRAIIIPMEEFVKYLSGEGIKRKEQQDILRW